MTPDHLQRAATPHNLDSRCGLGQCRAGAGKVRANHDVKTAERAEADARDAYHHAEDEARGRED